MKSRTPAAFLAAILDIVVNEQRVVQQLDRDRRPHRILEWRAKQPRRRDTYAGPHHLPAALRIVTQQVVQIAARFSRRQIFLIAARVRSPYSCSISGTRPDVVLFIVSEID